MRRDIDNTQDILDSRDIIERIEELEAEIADLDPASKEYAESDAVTELAVLKALEEEASGSPDWRYGEALIRDSYFKEYAEQWADDIGVIDRSASWPLNCIDWDEAALQLQQDYFSVEFDGVTYWIRS